MGAGIDIAGAPAAVATEPETEPEDGRLRGLRWIARGLGVLLALHALSIVLSGYWTLWKLVPYLSRGVWTVGLVGLLLVVAGGGQFSAAWRLLPRAPELAAARKRFLSAARMSMVPVALGAAWCAILAMSPLPAFGYEWLAVVWLVLSLPVAGLSALLAFVSPPGLGDGHEAAALPRSLSRRAAGLALFAAMALAAVVPWLRTDARDVWPQVALAPEPDTALAAIRRRTDWETRRAADWPRGSLWGFTSVFHVVQAALPALEEAAPDLLLAHDLVPRIAAEARDDPRRVTLLRAVIVDPALPRVWRQVAIGSAAPLAGSRRALFDALIEVLGDPATAPSADASAGYWDVRPAAEQRRDAPEALQAAVLQALPHYPRRLPEPAADVVRSFASSPTLGLLAKAVLARTDDGGVVVPDDG